MANGKLHEVSRIRDEHRVCACFHVKSGETSLMASIPWCHKNKILMDDETSKNNNQTQQQEYTNINL